MKTMRLSTSTSIMDRFQRVQNVVTMEECIQRCHAAGYRVLDMNFCDMSNPGMPLALDNWQSWAEKIANLAARLGIEFSQSHSHFYHFLNPKVENREFHDEMIRRSCIASGILGVKWMTVHASTETQTRGYSHKASKIGNLEYYPPYFELAFRHNVGVVIENMFDPTPIQRTYTANCEDLIDLVDAFHDSRVQVCWDIGHANLVGYDQCEALRTVGKRLKSTHFADNHGVKDEHLLPFYGDIDWAAIMKTLKEIEYEGDVTYEVTPWLDRVPPMLRDTALKHSVEVGEYLLKLAE